MILTMCFLIRHLQDGQNEQPTTATNASENSQPAPSPLPPPSPKVPS